MLLGGREAAGEDLGSTFSVHVISKILAPYIAYDKETWTPDGQPGTVKIDPGAVYTTDKGIMVKDGGPFMRILEWRP